MSALSTKYRMAKKVPSIEQKVSGDKHTHSNQLSRPRRFLRMKTHKKPLSNPWRGYICSWLATCEKKPTFPVIMQTRCPNPKTKIRMGQRRASTTDGHRIQDRKKTQTFSLHKIEKNTNLFFPCYHGRRARPQQQQQLRTRGTPVTSRV